MPSVDFYYYNANPNNLEEEDCVTRAIQLGLGLRYQTVRKLLDLTAYRYNCDPLCVCCYHHLLEDIFDLPVRYCNNGETALEIAKTYPNNKVIMRLDGHLTCAVHGAIADIWDCQDKLVDRYWII